MSEPTPISLTPDQVRAVELIVSGASTAETARAIGTSHTSIGRWRKQPAFAAAVTAAVQDRVSAAAMKLSAEVPKMVDVLVAMAQDPNVPAHTRAWCAGRVLELAGVGAEQPPALSARVGRRELRSGFAAAYGSAPEGEDQCGGAS